MQGELRNREARQHRLDEGTVHVLSAAEFGAALRREVEYQKNRRTGVTLMKTAELRVVLEAAEPGTTLASHVVHGPATIYLIEGGLEIETREGSFRAKQGDMVVLPRDEKRRILCGERSLFLLALSPEAGDEDSNV
jgi:quercetin dioxygenase-like cupin family protein